MELQELCRPGLHLLTEPVRIPSGTHLKAEEGARVAGCRMLSGFEDLGGGLYCCDLTALGIVPAPLQTRGFGCHILPAHSELFLDGMPMQISRFPKVGSYLTLTPVDDDPDYDFTFESDRPASWKKRSALWAHGYWRWDWSPRYEQILAFDPATNRVRISGRSRRNGQKEPDSFAAGQRFWFINVPEEVTEPGDYAIDYDANKVYLRTFDGTSPADHEILIATLGEPLFIIDEAEDVSLSGFLMEGDLSNAISITDSRHVRVENCEIRNIGSRGIALKNSYDVLFDRLTVHDTGDGGIYAESGDRKALIPAEIRIQNSEFYRAGRWNRCYEPPVTLHGIGMTARFNYMHDCPHSAVIFWGNDMDISDNEIAYVLLESGDAGAVYSGRDYSFRGNTVCRNYIHHLGGSFNTFTMGIYNDDCVSGTVMNDNIFYRCRRAVFIGGGREMKAFRNIFIDCAPSIDIDGRGAVYSQSWREQVNDCMRKRFYEVGGDSEAFLARYPEAAEIDAFFKSGDDVSIPPSADIQDNLFCSEQKISMRWGAVRGDFTFLNNRSVSFEDLRPRLTEKQYEEIRLDRERRRAMKNAPRPETEEPDEGDPAEPEED